MLCLAYRLPYWDEGRTGLWHPAFPQCGLDEADSWDDLSALFEWIDSGELIEAHNAFFERGVWTNIMAPRWHWPQIGHRQWRCSAAKAAAHSLPRGLEDAGDTLGLRTRKDTELADQVKKMWKPRNPLKAERVAWGRLHAPCEVCAATGKVKGINPETGRAKNFPCGRCSGNGFFITADIPEMPMLWHESAELFQMMFSYCRQDVLAEEAVSAALPDLDDNEVEIYLLDQALNERGFHLDTEAIDCALKLIDGEFVELNAELRELTGGKVERATQRARMLAWLAENGLHLEDSKAGTVDYALGRSDLSPAVRRGLELMRALGRSSTAKYEAMRDWVCPDSRVHGGLLYHGAGTGRWSGKGVQPHNFPKLTLLDQEELDEKGKPKAMDPELVWALLKTGDRETIVSEFGGVMEALSGALRGAINATPGKQLFVADYNAIECRVLFWVADDQEGLRIFREGRDPYNEMATTIYGYLVNRKKEEHKKQGQLGKAGILGLGYQMGASKFVETAATYGVELIEDNECANCFEGEKYHLRREPACDDYQPTLPPDTVTSVRVVNAYRSKFHRVVQLWKDQEYAAIRAVQRPGERIRAGKVSWEMGGDDHPFLYCILPSGRRLAYPDPEIHQKPVPWGGTRPSLTYMGVNAKFGGHSWQRQTAYGGMLVENIVQAISRDLMAEAMLRAEHTGTYEPILSVHDELIAEAVCGDVHEFEALMAAVPPWGRGCPVTAEGWAGSRYRK